MIVDDDQVILSGLAGIIKKFNIPNSEIIIAFDGIDALEKLKGLGADLVITDISMPGMNGLELIKEAKALHYCNRFVILTGYDEFEFARRAIKYQVNDYLLKPINKDELLEIIHKVENEINGHDKPGKKLVLPDIDVCISTLDRKCCSEKMVKILEYIDGNYAFDISLNQIGKEFNLHPNYICSLFSEQDTTFLHYLEGVRIRKSIELLLYEKDKTIKDIATVSGFMNERQFYKVFRKRVGSTPGQFREMYG
jgi:Response regulator containing CheY-like receiver domain and AraC-type DNA-binding domain